MMAMESRRWGTQTCPVPGGGSPSERKGGQNAVQTLGLAEHLWKLLVEVRMVWKQDWDDIQEVG